MTNISYNKAIITDALRISILMKTVYIQTYGFEGITFEFANFIQKRFSQEFIENIIKENPSRLIVAFKNDNPIGVAEIDFKGVCPIRKIPVIELSKLYVLERFHGNGIGYKLINEVEKEILNHSQSQYFLTAYIKNFRAIKFYERQGFLIIGNVDFPMETNTYENVLMNKVLQ